MLCPPGFYPGTSLVPLVVNDMPGAIGCEMLLYADDTCVVFQAKDLDSISKKLNTEFNKLCDWFVDNKLTIHFRDDKTKSILFSGKNHPRDDKLKISRGTTEVAQHKEMNYLGCLFDDKCTGESMALKVIEKINGRHKFLWRKNKFLTPPLKRLL